MEDCQGSFEKAFSDLAARCTNVDEVSARYRESPQCVAGVECDEMGPDMRSRELAGYEAAKTAGGTACEPDDD